jgi:hypothetical protein
MNVNRYHRCSINLNGETHDKAKYLADKLAMSISSIVKCLILNAFQEHKNRFGDEPANSICPGHNLLFPVFERKDH